MSLGMGYEAVQSNNGYYLDPGSFPYADLAIRIDYNRFTGFYSLSPLKSYQQQKDYNYLNDKYDYPNYNE